MEITPVEREDGVTQVALKGKLDVMGMNAIDVKFHGLVAAQRQPAIIDLSEVDFMASLGMGMLISCAQALKKQSCAMVLLNPQENVEEVLRMAGIDKAMPIVKDLDEANRLVQPA